MDHDHHKREISALRAANTRKEVAVVFLSIGLLVALIIIYSIRGSERTIVAPPNIERSFWVRGDHASKEYLEQMASYVAYLILDADPKSTAWKRDVLLGWADPAHYQALKEQIERESERLRSSNATTTFALHSLLADEKTQQVRLDGTFEMRVNGTPVSAPRRAAYLAEFGFKGGRMHLMTFKEIDHETAGHATAGASVRAAAGKQP